MMQRHSLLLFLCLLPLSAWSQIVAWQLKPSDYAAISRFGSNLYEVSRDGKTGFIRSDGTVVVPAVVDQVVGFYDHKALLLIHDSGQERIAGYLTDEGQYVAFQQKFYTLGGQEFYSDGLLTVADEKGRKGYVDEHGKPAFGFNKKYYRIKPFTEGYAAVSPEKKFYHLIDRRGEKVVIKLPQIGTVGQVSNPYGGVAYVLDTDNNYYLFNVNTGKCESARVKDASKDYLFRLKKDSKADNTIPYVTLPPGRQGMKPVQSQGKYGFSQGGRTVLPAQLESATPFEDDLSIVRLDGRLGILRLITGQSDFALSVPQANIEFGAGSSVDFAFGLDVPQAWAGKPMQVQVTDSDTGDQLEASAQADGYAFHMHPRASGTKTFNVAVASEGLSLWQGPVTYTLKRKVVDLVLSGLALSSETAGEDDQIAGSFTVTNPNEEAVSADLSLRHSSGIASATCPDNVSLQPGESRTIGFRIVVKKDCLDQTITVTTSRGGMVTLSVSSLNAF